MINLFTTTRPGRPPEHDKRPWTPAVRADNTWTGINPHLKGAVLGSHFMFPPNWYIIVFPKES